MNQAGAIHHNISSTGGYHRFSSEEQVQNQLAVVEGKNSFPESPDRPSQARIKRLKKYRVTTAFVCSSLEGLFKSVINFCCKWVAIPTIYYAATGAASPVTLSSAFFMIVTVAVSYTAVCLVIAGVPKLCYLLLNGKRARLNNFKDFYEPKLEQLEERTCNASQSYIRGYEKKPLVKQVMSLTGDLTEERQQLQSHLEKRVEERQRWEADILRPHVPGKNPCLRNSVEYAAVLGSVPYDSPAMTAVMRHGQQASRHERWFNWQWTANQHKRLSKMERAGFRQHPALKELRSELDKTTDGQYSKRCSEYQMRAFANEQREYAAYEKDLRQIASDVEYLEEELKQRWHHGCLNRVLRPFYSCLNYFVDIKRLTDRVARKREQEENKNA